MFRPMVPRAVITHHDKVIMRVHAVHLMNVGQRQASADPQSNQPPQAVILPVGCHLQLELLITKADTHLPSHGG